MTTHDNLLHLAEGLISSGPTGGVDGIEIKASAKVRLADLLTVGLRRGMEPAESAAAGDLPTFCLHACRELRAWRTRPFMQSRASGRPCRWPPAWG